MATNIPFAFMAYVWDDKKKAFPWSLNPDFVKLVKERFSPEGTILVTCYSGGRGAMAINMLAAAGFTNAYNILDRMEGQPGRRPRPRVQRHAPWAMPVWHNLTGHRGRVDCDG
jgi:rhodanese-related sulfurtransferase